MAASQHIPITALIEHAESLDADLPLARAHIECARRQRDYLGIISGNKFVGVAFLPHISQALGTQFGHALFGREPLRKHTLRDPLVVAPETPLTELLKMASARKDADFFKDIAVVSAQGVFVGMIPMSRLARLQTSLLLENIAEVDSQRQELAVRNREMEDDLRMAREVQLAILPAESVRMEHARQVVTIQHLYSPSEVIGGDFFGVFHPSPTTLGLLVCDVMGHSVRSALITTIISALAKEAHPNRFDPGQMLTGLNQDLHKILQSVSTTLFVTAACVTIDLVKNEIAYSQAGHPSGLLWNAKEGKSASLKLPPEAEGPALGLLDDMVFATARSPIGAGDALLLFTDGVTEATDADGDEFGTERLCQTFDRALVSGTTNIARSVADAARAHAADGRFTDDVCVVVASLQTHPVRPVEAEPVESISLIS